VLSAEIAALDKLLKTQTPALDAAQAQWEKEILAAQSAWIALDPETFVSTAGATLTKLEDKSLLAGGANADDETYIVTSTSRLETITAIGLEVMPDASLPKGGPGRNPYGNFQLAAVELEANGRRASFKTAAVDSSSGRFDAANFLKGEQPWAIDATRDVARFKRQAVLALDQPLNLTKGAAGIPLTIRLKHLGRGFGQSIGRLRLSVTASDDPLRITMIPAKLRPLLDVALAGRTAAQREELAAHYRGLAPSLEQARRRLPELRVALSQLAIPSALILQERASFERPSTWFRERGSYLSPGERVYAATPRALPPIPESASYNRLGLARWLVDESNPLTARVVVNRAWEQFFGIGLVETSEDFGTQGAPPSHPELLDWLAVEFRNPQTAIGNQQSKPWSLKALHRLIVTSATYRQSSAGAPALLEKDPGNRLLARGPRFRMVAVMVRDAMLAASGLLNRKLGGPSVFPPQPGSIWANNYIRDKWKESEGADRYRRSLYTFWRRTAPHPGMTAFDATTRETCTVRRVRTNTPLQALTLLNDDASFEIARGLARRIVSELPAGGVKDRARYGFRLCRARAPNAAELERLTRFFEEQRAHFTRDPQSAGQVAGSSQAGAELAAWTMTANVLLNLDGTITKE
jgi:hypothetical protein